MLSFCLKALNREISLHEVNIMRIILIPKHNATDSMLAFRPISLCSVLYNIISKVLANQYGFGGLY